MTNLEAAIAELQAQFDRFEPGTPNAPKEGSTEWFLLRASTLGLGYAKRVMAIGAADDPLAADRIYREGIRVLKVA